MTPAEQRLNRRLERRITRQRRSLERAAAARESRQQHEPKTTPGDFVAWSDTVAMVARLRRTAFRRRVFRPRQLLRPAAATASFALVVAAVTPGLAHWVDETSAQIGVTAGAIEVTVDGELSFDLGPCVGEAESVCHKLEDEALSGLPVVTVGDAQVAIVEWIDKEPGEHVGFVFELVGGTAELTMRSGDPDNGNGSLVTASFEQPGTHTWLNPACEIDPATGGATCDPGSTSAILYIDICLTEIVSAGCPGVATADVVVDNAGSIPFELGFGLADPEGVLCSDETAVMEATVSLLDPGGEPLPDPAYMGSVCFLEVAGELPLAGQVDPGDSVGLRVEVELGAGELPPPQGIDVVSGMAFMATQWNTSDGWQVRKTLPMTVHGDVEPPTPVPPEVDLNLPPPPAEPPPPEPPAEEPPPPEPPVDDPPVTEPPEPEIAEVGGVVWLDDADGVRSAGEPGFEGVVVEAIVGADGTVADSTLTAADGSYVLEVEVGTYLVRFAAPDGHTFTPPHQGADPIVDSDVVVVDEVSGTEVLVLLGWTDPIEVVAEMPHGAADAGLEPPAPDDPPVDEPPPSEPPPEQPPELAELSGIVWLDDGDGIRQSAEMGAEGVGVFLHTISDGGIARQTTTDSDGSYLLEAEPGSYRVQFQVPEDNAFADAHQGIDPALDSDVIEVFVSESTTFGWTAPFDLDTETGSGAADAGLLAPEEPAEPDPALSSVRNVRGVVWLDDGDGVRTDADDAVEPPVPGEVRMGSVAVLLHADTEGEPLQETTTAEDGTYGFEVEPGNYWLRFAAPEGHTFTLAHIGDDSSVDSDAIGLVEVVAEDGSVSLQGWTEEIVVEATDVTNLDAGVLAPPVDDYYPPADDSEPPPEDEEPPADGGEPPAEPDESVPVTFSGVVWFDDGDGVRVDPDPEDEPGSIEPEARASGAVVTLHEMNRTTVVAQVTADADGAYEFVDIPQGDYLIRFEPVGGHAFTRANQGSDEEIDSDVVEVEEILVDGELEELYGWTARLAVAADMELGLVDAGLVRLPPEETNSDAPPAEDPGEVAVEPPETPGNREDEQPADPTAPDDDGGEDDAAEDSAGQDGGEVGESDETDGGETGSGSGEGEA